MYVFCFLVQMSLLSDTSTELEFSSGEFVEIRSTKTKQQVDDPELSFESSEEEVEEGEEEVEGGEEEGEEEEEEEGEEEGKEEGEGEEGEEGQSNNLFFCPSQGCVFSYLKYSSLEYHILYGKCKLLEENNTLLDKAKILYTQKISEGTSSLPQISVQSTTSTSLPTALSQGWALRKTKTSARFNDNQRRYLDERFKLGQITGHKADPSQVARDLRHAKNENGERRFTVSEFLSAKQIQSYFSRASAKLKQAEVSEEEIDVNAIEDERAYSSARDEIIQECQLSHPIIYDTYNLCHLYEASKLKRLSIALLREMCTYFHMEVDSLPVTRKAPYIALLNELAASCSCSE
jgi:hypothetical protein